MIEVQSLSKHFGEVHAVRDVSFNAADGRITALLGPNGAGKSTTLRILATVISADSGQASVGGSDVALDPMAARRKIGVMPHNAGVYPRLTARENIRYFGELQGLPRDELEARIEHLIQQLEMSEFADRRVKGFSQGQSVKVALARALVHDPSHVILDEPTNGLDVMATRALRDIILNLKDEGRCVLFSSHIMQEVSNLCDDVTIIGKGMVLYEGTLEGLRDHAGQEDLEEAFVSLIGATENDPS